MIKAKDGKKVVGSYKTIEEAANAMVKNGAANINAAVWNINAVIRGNEGRVNDTQYHQNGQPRKTAYGFTWSTTKR